MKFFFNGLIATGIFYGICLVIAFEFLTDFFGPDFNPSGELFATLIGAAIGLSGTILTIHASIEAKKDEQLDRDKALVSEIFVKFQKMVNNLYHFRDHFRSEFSSVDPSSHANPALFVRALSGYPDTIHFSTEEKALFLRRKRVELANDVSEWDDIHNSLLRAMQTYGQLRQQFTMSTPAEMSGTVGTSSLTPEEFSRVAPVIAQLNDLAQQIRLRSEREYPDCLRVLNRIRDELRDVCGIKVDLTLPE